MARERNETQADIMAGGTGSYGSPITPRRKLKHLPMDDDGTPACPGGKVAHLRQVAQLDDGSSSEDSTVPPSGPAFGTALQPGGVRPAAQFAPNCMQLNPPAWSTMRKNVSEDCAPARSPRPDQATDMLRHVGSPRQLRTLLTVIYHRDSEVAKAIQARLQCLK